MISKNDNTKEWRVVSLGAVTTKIGSGATPRGGAEAYKKEGISLIRSQNVLDFDFSYRGLAFIDEQQAKKLSNVSIEENDVLINITGDSVARVCMVPAKVIPARVNQHVAIIRASKTKLDSYYLLYYLLNTYFKKHLLKLASDGATRNALTKSDIEGLSINLPPLPEQKAIAKVLTAFDDKIELLQAQNKTLETMAQTIFIEWFGKHQIGDELPEGWRVGKVGDLVNLKSGFSFKSKNFIENGDYKLVTIRNVKNGFFDKSTKDKLNELPKKLPNHCILKTGDILISLTGNVGRTCHVIGDNYLLNQRVCLADPFLKEYFGLTYCLFRSKPIFKSMESISVGTAQLNLSPVQTQEISIVIPSSLILGQISKSINPLIKKLIVNNIQIDTLSKIRDTLMPKLMSGQVRVNNLNEKSNIVSGDLIEGAEGTIPNNIVDDGPKINLF